jgi:DNA polymerase-3 subunit epsilon
VAHELGVPLVSDAKFMDCVSAVANGTGVDNVVEMAHTGEQFALF